MVFEILSQDFFKVMAESVYSELMKDLEEGRPTENSLSGHPNKISKVLEAGIEPIPYTKWSSLFKHDLDT